MAQDATREIGSAGKKGLCTVLVVPDEQAQAVIDFVASLQRGDAEVSGHMLGLGGRAGLSGGPLLASAWDTHTGCSTVATGASKDITCTDIDGTFP